MTAKIIPVPNSVKNNLTGRRFGRWTVLGYTGALSGKSTWLCRCDCGREGVVQGSQLTGGHSLSCGCRRSENMAFLKHGRSRTPEHNAWKAMNRRCHTPTNAQYPNYGGRGIKVCRRWRDSFEAFYSDMGPRPSDEHSLDRIDNDGDYEPGNCRWATRVEQGNNRRTNRPITYKGQTRTVSEWAAITGLSEEVILYRLKSGWTADRALTEPLRPSRR